MNTQSRVHKVKIRWSVQYFCRTLVEAFQVHNRSGRSSCEGVEQEGQGCWVRNTDHRQIYGVRSQECDVDSLHVDS